MKNTRRFTILSLAGILTALLNLLILGQGNLTFAWDIGDLGKKSAGTYLSVENEVSTILQINRDGNLNLVFSGQFSGGALNNPFSNILGSWRRSGKRELTSTAVDITFERGSGNFVGVAAVTYVINFDKKFQSALVKCEGAIFPPGENPFAPGAEPIMDSHFDCGDEGFVVQRLPEYQRKNLRGYRR